MFTDGFCEEWDSTGKQDDFIRKYFSKTKVNPTTKNSPRKACQQESENSLSKKEKKSLLVSPQEYSSEIDSHSQKIQVTESLKYESKNFKKKLANKKIANESLKRIKNVGNLNVETDINNFCANSIKETDLCNNEKNSDCLKLKKKRKRLKKRSISEENLSVPNEKETVFDAVYNNSSKRNNDLSENDSDYSTLKMKKKKKKLKNKLKTNSFSDEPESISDVVCSNSTIKESNLFRNNSDSNSPKKKKKQIQNSEKTLEHDEFSDEIGSTSFEISRDLLIKKNNLLQNKAYQKLQAAKFRYLNEMLYTNSGKDALSYFQENTDEYLDYHLGYQSQVSKWPINPVDIIVQEISRMNKQAVIADLGCGEAKIAEVFPKKTVHSFDLIALKDCVTACDIANVPLSTNSVDIVVFCLSLMGTNWKDYLKESQRILKFGGIMKIAEIESRIENLQHFIKEIENFGFSLVNQNLSHKMFVFLNFKRENRNKKSSKVHEVTLKPCLYKKR